MIDYVDWIALHDVKGLGEVTYKKLISEYSDPRNVFAADYDDLLKIEGLKSGVAKEIRNFSDWDSARQQADKLEKLGVGLLVLTDPDYPQGLYDTYNPPPYLYIAGSFAPEDKRAIAVVGTRTPDAYGKKITEQLTAELVRHGFTIVSGFARGIDTIAHKACLKAGGRTIAVLGSGIDLVYPPENGKLYKDIAQK
nr:DNA-protecting protein DprA [Candidatus Dadabacteria bacterium]